MGELRFVTPRALWMREERPRLLLVDEAAALPVPLLERLLENRASLVFATTTHGYEGTGRGFSLRFRPKLQRAVRKLYEPKLVTPLRWAVGDPAEIWSSRALLLETSLPLKPQLDASLDTLEYERFSSAEIARRPVIYEQVFALLVNAHYRTQPSDLWRMLDAPNLQSNGSNLLVSIDATHFPTQSFFFVTLHLSAFPSFLPQSLYSISFLPSLSPDSYD